MDRLAADGVRFTTAVNVSPICMPARASFIAGTYPHNHGLWWNGGKLPAEDETFFHHLQSTGYCTAHIGKSHYYAWSGGGDREIHVLATAKSVVDGKDYPMAFVRTVGKGRVLHTVLGHDVTAFRAPGVVTLMQRACVWAAGETP